MRPGKWFGLSAIEKGDIWSRWKAGQSLHELFVSDGGARGARKMNDIKAVKSDFSAPRAEIRCGVVERVAELNEHVQRHEQSEDVLATGIVYEGFDCDKGSPPLSKRKV